MAGRAYVGITSHIVRRGLARKIASTPTGVTGLYEMHQNLGDIQTAIDIIKVVDVLVDGSSSQDLVQNGGPSAPLVQRGKSSDVLSLGKTLKTQSAHGFRSGKARTAGGKRRSRRCPYHWRYGGWTEKGYWTTSYKRGPRCIHRAGHRGPHKK